VPKWALQAGSAVSTLVTSAKSQGVDPPAPTASSHQKRREVERQARVCGPAACGTFSLLLLLIVLLATKFESPVCEGGLMGSRFKDRELETIKEDKRGVAEAGAAGGVGCFDVGNFCHGVGCRSADSNGSIS